MAPGPDSSVPFSSHSSYGAPERGKEHYVMGPPDHKNKPPRIFRCNRSKTAPLRNRLFSKLIFVHNAENLMVAGFHIYPVACSSRKLSSLCWFVCLAHASCTLLNSTTDPWGTGEWVSRSRGWLQDILRKKQGGSGTELEPETGTVRTVFPETESGTGTAGTFFWGTETGTGTPSFPLKMYWNTEKPFLQRNRRNQKPEPIEPFHPQTVTEPNRGYSEKELLALWSCPSSTRSIRNPPDSAWKPERLQPLDVVHLKVLIH